MSRSEYLKTPAGQLHERNKRTLKTNYFFIDQEPKSKNALSSADKIDFRKEIKKQLSARKRRAHRGDIILEIDFYTTMNNPAAVHTLTKNYLDLLHKEMPKQDSLSKILFNDDSQIKILIANYHLNHRGNNKPRIAVTSYPLSNFIKDVELAYMILNGKLNPFEDDRDERFRSIADLKKDFDNHIKNEETILPKIGLELFQQQKEYFSRLLQEEYIRLNSIKTRDLVNVFQREFSHNKKNSGDDFFERIWNITREYVFYSSDFVGLGGAPIKEGESSEFQKRLTDELTKFKENHSFLFPILQPISVTILFIPPEKLRPDSDNLARHILPFLTDIFQPPSTLARPKQSTSKNPIQRHLPHGLTGYQLIQIPRQKNDPVNGKIEFAISDGLLFHSNIWKEVDRLIEKWEKTLR